MRARWLMGLAVLMGSQSAFATVLDPTLTETVLVSFNPALGYATGIAWPPDGSNRLFVARQVGEIYIVKDGVLMATPFATVAPVYNVPGGELGLIGIAFDPNFTVTHHVYVFATVSPTEQQIIRYTAVGDLGTDKTIIVAGLPTRGLNHNGGAVGIGPDGKLYWGIGDNGAGVGAGDDTLSLGAKISRANLDGTPVADNPFNDGPGPNADHIWARGFRNPFTLTFQPTTGLLWVNVVGTSYEQAFIVRRGDNAGWSLYENSPVPAYISPMVKYRTTGVDTRTLLPAAMSGAVRAGGVVTFTTSDPHYFRKGEKITVAGVADPSFNADLFIASVPSATSFTATQAGSDAVSGAGTATTAAIGGCITGGAFYDATDFPGSYRGNFFFGDYNTHRIERVTFDAASNTVTSVDLFATDVNTAVDIAVGPDGALYYLGHVGQVLYRTSSNATAQRLVVSPTNLWTAEGEPSVAMVRLGVAPAAATTVTVARSGGDADIGVVTGATLTFTSANWSTPQPVTIVAGRDLDAADDLATVSVTAAGMAAEAVTIHARDDNSLGLVVSAPTLAVREGASSTFTVALSAQPSVDVAVTVSRSSGDADVGVTAGAALTFTNGTWSTPQTVTIAAASDPDGSDDTATVSVAAPGVVAQTVTVTVTDDGTAPVITSTPVTTAVVGTLYRYDVQSAGLPAPTFTLDVAPTGMLIDAATGVISWHPAALGSFPVTVRAGNGTPPDATQVFGIEVTAAGFDAAAEAGAPPDGGSSAATDAADAADAGEPGDGGRDVNPLDGSSDGGKAADDSGCGCRTVGRARGTPGLLWLVLGAVGAARRRSRRR